MVRGRGKSLERRRKRSVPHGRRRVSEETREKISKALLAYYRAKGMGKDVLLRKAITPQKRVKLVGVDSRGRRRFDPKNRLLTVGIRRKPGSRLTIRHGKRDTRMQFRRRLWTNRVWHSYRQRRGRR